MKRRESTGKTNRNFGNSHQSLLLCSLTAMRFHWCSNFSTNGLYANSRGKIKYLGIYLVNSSTSGNSIPGL